MESINAFLHRKLDNFSFDEYLVMFVLCSLFLPFYCSSLAMFIVLLYFIKQRRLIPMIKNTKGSLFIIAFCIISMLVSIFYRNLEGVIHTWMMALIFIFMICYRKIVTKRLFELLMDACCIISIFCAIWAILEYLQILKQLDYPHFMFQVEDSPKYRINSTFMNANYYAMMIEFIVLICLYKMIQMKSKHRIVFYVITILLNLFVLYLSGCRTAWIPFLVSIPFMFLINKRSAYFNASAAGILGGVSAILVEPSLMKRASSILVDFAKRKKIWDCAIEGIKNNPWLGRGPRTYHQIYPIYGGHPTYHAHNIELDLLVSHGIIGTLLLFGYLFYNLKEVIIMIKRRLDLRLCSLIIAFIITILIHGILDCTIYWPQTGGLFMFVLSSSSLYFNQKDCFNLAE